MGLISNLLTSLASNASTAASNASGIVAGSDILSTNFNGYGSTMTSLNSFASQAEPFFVPTGALMPFAASNAPSGWYLCDGRSWATLGLGAGNALYDLLNPLGWSGLPDLQGKTIIGVQSGTYALKTSYGATTQTLGTTNLPKHTHDWSTTGTGTHVHNYYRAYNANEQIPGTGATSYTVDASSRGYGGVITLNVGGNGAHDHSGTTTDGTGTFNATPFSLLQPSLALNYIIKG